MFKKLTVLILLLPLTIHAAEDNDDTGGAWSGEGALGFTSTSGNTDSENLNASLKIGRQRERWKHAASIEAIRNEVDDEVSADRNVLKLRSEYSLGEKSYLYGQLRYEDDEFSGYDSQTAVSLGAGSRLLDDGRHRLDVSAGIGYRRLEERETGDEDESAIVTGDLLYEYEISESAILKEAILVESGDENTYSESETALKMKINGNLAAKIAYLVKHNSDVPAGTEKTDKITTISLVYSF